MSGTFLHVPVAHWLALRAHFVAQRIATTLLWVSRAHRLALRISGWQLIAASHTNTDILAVRRLLGTKKSSWDRPLLFFIGHYPANTPPR